SPRARRRLAALRLPAPALELARPDAITGAGRRGSQPGGGLQDRLPRLSGGLGRTPSLEQSGETASQGAISKTGSSIARRLLVESALHYLRRPTIGVTLQNRQAGQPDHVLQSPGAPNTGCIASITGCASAVSPPT